MEEQGGQNQIIINNKVYSHKQIVNTSISVGTSFEKNTIAFCKAWLTGEERFTVTTSGSTGQPRPITLTREQMLKSAQKVGKVIGLKPGYTALICLDSQYIAGMMMLVRSFAFSMNSYVITPSSNPLNNVPESIAIDVASFVPYQLDCILTSPCRRRVDNMRCMLVGGAPIFPSLIDKIAGLSFPVYATYGMTETAAAIALRKCNGSDAQSYFHALPGVLLSQNNDSCLVIEADHLPHPIITRDRIVMKGKNQFQWLGRQDNIVNSGGIKIIPERLENSIQNLFDTLQLSNNFFVMGLPDRQLGERACLIIEGQLPNGCTTEGVIEKIKTFMPAYEAPKEIRFVEQFINTRSGKIDRKKTALCVHAHTKV